MKSQAFTCSIAVLAALFLARVAQAAATMLDANRYHLRSGVAPEWQEFAGKTPHGQRLDLHFTAQKNKTASTLFLWQSDVKLDWAATLNGTKVGKLFLMESPLVYALEIPAGSLRSGENTLSITPPKEKDDILVGRVQLDPRPLQEALGDATLEIQVVDVENRRDLPCRITIVDGEAALAAITSNAQRSTLNAQPALGLRPGVVYTRDGHARLGVLPGAYTLYASRGFEYSLATTNLSVAAGQKRRLRMEIRREVPTPGLVSCDTHIHTFTYAKHGDASIDERMLTLAGEGIELPISTEHNVLIDFSEAAKRNGVQAFFTPVVGCEVTTKAGHFNAFPIESGSRAPDFRLGDWPRLMESIRSTPGVRVVVLNHPRDVHDAFVPFAEANFNAVTGENRRGFEFSFDAVELINSGALRTDPMQVYRDWFALLNYGYRITGVGASDSHDVSRFIVGQGRTYVACADEDPAKLNIQQACQSLRDGRALVSLGLLTQLTVDQRFGVGALATNLGDKVRVSVAVLGPSWTSADRVELFANGLKVRERMLEPTTAIQKAKVEWLLPRPAHDVYVVAVASGPGVTSPHWAIPRPYQPSSPSWEPRVMGSTNPIWIDADGDGKFTAARGYAQQLVAKFGPEPDKLLPALASYDSAIAAQAASLCQAAGRDVRDARFARALEQARAPVQQGFAAFIATLSKPEASSPKP